jgi:hypothetical protein
MSHSGLTRPSESKQSNAPAPGAGDTHDGAGGNSSQRSNASSYSVPSGQTPASFGGPAKHPYAGVRQSWEGSQSASPQAKAAASLGPASPFDPAASKASAPVAPFVAPPQPRRLHPQPTPRTSVIAVVRNADAVMLVLERKPRATETIPGSPRKVSPDARKVCHGVIGTPGRAWDSLGLGTCRHDVVGRTVTSHRVKAHAPPAALPAPPPAWAAPYAAMAL